MTTKLWLAVGVLQALTSSEVRAAEPHCLDLPIAASPERPMLISQLFHDPRPAPSGLRNRDLWRGSGHDGLDIVLPGGSELRALAGGRVLMAGLDAEGTGLIVVRTSVGRRYYFAHVYAFGVRRGDRVRRSQVLGWSGGAPGVYGTGPHSNGEHLHLTVLDRQGRPLDPLRAFCRELRSSLRVALRR